jgi:uncharacterized protein YbbK (DUF523 family)
MIASSKFQKGRPFVLVSACLLGINCRYDGGNALNEKLVSDDSIIKIPFCPEQLGGLSTPREEAEIETGDGKTVLAGKAKVIGSRSGKNYTHYFLKGVEESWKMAQFFSCQKALLKRNSPSCGVGTIRRKGQLIDGNGVTAAFLISKGISVEVI